MADALTRWRERSLKAELDAWERKDDQDLAVASGHASAREAVFFIVNNEETAILALEHAVEHERVKLKTLQLALDWLREEAERA